LSSYNPHRDEFNFIPPNQPGEPKALTALPPDIPREFWCGNEAVLVGATSQHCCFNHYIGLPEKDGVVMPLFDYEEELFRTLGTYKYVWIKKARGLGITEFMLRYILWLVTTNELFRNAQVGIITGPRLKTAIDLIKRLKSLARQLDFTSKDEQTVLELNSVVITAFPSGHMYSFRGYTNMKFILLDEADFFRHDQQTEAIDASLGYGPKSNPQIVMISTPNNPGGLFDQIEHDTGEKYGKFHKVYMPYTVGLNKIYNEKDIEEAKRDPSFEREYNLRYGYGIGNVFMHAKIEAAIKEYEFDNYTIHASPTSIGVDPGFGSSNFAIVVTTLIDGLIHVLEAEEYKHPDHGAMIDRIFDIKIKYGAQKVYVDASNPAIIRALKSAIRENEDYESVKALATKDKVRIDQRMDIVPVNFGTEGRHMTTSLQSMVSSEAIRIHPRFDTLITQLRVVRTTDTGQIDKSVSQNDTFDALRCACMMFYFGGN
jgi:hypothetical protein